MNRSMCLEPPGGASQRRGEETFPVILEDPRARGPCSSISHDLLPCGKELTQIVGVHRFRAPQDCERSTVRISRARDEDTRVQDRLSPAIQTIHASLLSGLHNPTPAGSPGTDSPPQTTLKPGAVSGATAPGSLEASLRLRSRPHCPPSSLLPPPGSSGQTRGAGAGPRMRLPGPRW